MTGSGIFGALHVANLQRRRIESFIGGNRDAGTVALFGNTTTKNCSPQGVFPGHYHLVNPEWKKNGDQTFGISPEEVFERMQKIMAALG